MIRLSIRRKIMGIAVALIVLMAITAILSMILVIQVGDRLQELTDSYIPAYGHLARANIRSLERALTLRRMIIEKLQSPSSGGTSAAIRSAFDAKGAEVEQEAQAAHALIKGLIDKGTKFGDATTLARLESRIDTAMADTRRHLNGEIGRLLAALDAGDAKAIADGLARVDALRDDLNQKLDAIRADMLALLQKDAAMTIRKQRQVMLIAARLDGARRRAGAGIRDIGQRRHDASGPSAAGGRARGRGGPSRRNARRHLEGRDRPLDHRLQPDGRAVAPQGAHPRDLRQICRSARRRRTDRPAGAWRRRTASRHDRAVLRCQRIHQRQRGDDAAGSRQGHEPLLFDDVRADPRSWGIIDKYIGDAIMAYWGPPFTDDADQARLASLAALDMLQLVAVIAGRISRTARRSHACRSRSIYASALRPAKCWSAASAPS